MFARRWKTLLVFPLLLTAASVTPLFATEPVTLVSHIRRESIASSALASVGYSKRRHILEIEFLNGGLYRYLDVPASVHRELMEAESKTHYYDSYIKGNYRSLRLRGAQLQTGNDTRPGLR